MITNINTILSLRTNHYQVNYNLDKVNILVGETGSGKTRLLRCIEDKPLYLGIIIERYSGKGDNYSQKFCNAVPTDKSKQLLFDFLQCEKTDYNLSKGEDKVFHIFNVLEWYIRSGRKEIVLFDDLEEGLDIFKQKRILPFVQQHYPDIQIIATTHSPFIFDNEFDKNTLSINDIMTKL